MKNFRPSTGAHPDAKAHMHEALNNVLQDAEEKVKKKKTTKKKSKKSVAQTDLLFEGGDSK